MRSRPAPPPLSDTCLNCGTAVETKFCGACGQENEPPTPGFGSVLGDLWQEFLQVDGKVLKTLWYLLSRPGFLSAEYVAGKRISYVSPFKLYFWTTALFVIFFLRLNLIDSEKLQRTSDQIAQQVAQDAKKNNKETQKNKKVNIKIDENPIKIDNRTIKKQEALVAATEEILPTLMSRKMIFLGEPIELSTVPKTVLDYRESKIYQNDSLKRRFVIERFIRIKNNPWEGLKSLVSGALPNVLIFCVPIWALVIKLFFPRRLYIEHLIFALHTHIVGIVLLALSLGIKVTLGPPAWASVFPIVGMLVYNFVAARRFYQGHPAWLILKGGLLSCAYGCILQVAITIGLLVTLLWTILNA